MSSLQFPPSLGEFTLLFIGSNKFPSFPSFPPLSFSPEIMAFWLSFALLTPVPNSHCCRIRSGQFPFPAAPLSRSRLIYPTEGVRALMGPPPADNIPPGVTIDVLFPGTPLRAFSISCLSPNEFRERVTECTFLSLSDSFYCPRPNKTFSLLLPRGAA